MIEWQVREGDCLELMAAMEPSSVDAVITDPPYSSGGSMRGDRMQSTRAKYVQSNASHTLADFTGDNRDQRGYLAWSTLWLSRARQLSKPGALCCVFSDWRQLPTTTDAVQAAGWVWRGIAVWGKTTARPCKGRYAAQSEFVVWGTNGPRELDGACARGLWVESPVPTAHRAHITQKPESVMRGLLQPVAAGGLVLDPFCGSGSTGTAAVLEGFGFIGCELNPEYAEIARARICAAHDGRSMFSEASA